MSRNTDDSSDTKGQFLESGGAEVVSPQSAQHREAPSSTFC